MKNKKIILIVMIILVVCVIGFVVFKVTHNENYLYNNDGTITDGHKELIDHLKNIEDKDERKKQIDFSLEQNVITQEEANELY